MLVVLRRVEVSLQAGLWFSVVVVCRLEFRVVCRVVLSSLCRSGFDANLLREVVSEHTAMVKRDLRDGGSVFAELFWKFVADMRGYDQRSHVAPN